MVQKHDEEGKRPHQIDGAWAGTVALHWLRPELVAVIGSLAARGPLVRLGPVLARDESDFYLRPATAAESATFDAALGSHAWSVEDVIEDAQPIHRAADLLAGLADELSDNQAARAGFTRGK
jgi:hypothetical protein